MTELTNIDSSENLINIDFQRSFAEVQLLGSVIPTDIKNLLLNNPKNVQSFTFRKEKIQERLQEFSTAVKTLMQEFDKVPMPNSNSTNG